MVKKTFSRDPSSLSNSDQLRVTHLDWIVRVDFDEQVLKCEATLSFDRLDGSAQYLDLDTSALAVHSVIDPAVDGAPLEYILHEPSYGQPPHLGRRLSIRVGDASSSSVSRVRIAYDTTAAASALQWLAPAQTAGRTHPYLFTQCQAIHARSLVPCQDEPSVKMTLAATVTVPGWATCVMSAVRQEEQVAVGGAPPAATTSKWRQTVPMSSYLIALAVGQLERRDLSARCAVWSEPPLVDAAAFEFAQTEDFLRIAEDIAGLPYVWGRYDILCLPPSFPYGGMENPCLTFVTPTLLAGDRSLADVIAHEIAHSWTGNLVTNATWSHFWLNEGWTTWFQRKIMARIHNDPLFIDLDAIGGYKALKTTVESEMPPKYTRLVLPNERTDPDEMYSTVAYEKGFNMLLALERLVGTKAFEAFFQAYIKNFQNRTLTSEEFKDFALYLFDDNPDVEAFDWDGWLYGEGMPPVAPTFDRTLSQKSDDLAALWLAVDRDGRMLPTTDTSSWSSLQITNFLDQLQTLTKDKHLQVSTLNAMNRVHRLTQSQNAEILFRYCLMCLESEDPGVLSAVIYFVTSQGRMKYVRPLYRAMFKSPMSRDIAQRVFLDHKDFYHPICAKMIASDLTIGKTIGKGRLMRVLSYAAVVGAVSGLGFLAWRRKR